MTLQTGTRLGSYELTSLLGSGGMGEVYRAKDHKLGRDVAIKVLREELASDPERLRRFEQEARSASALNHPNIITIHDIGKHESTPHIAMEYVEGKTLREMLADGPLPTKKLLQLATQIAEGQAKAHSAGIVHRDLKPENLMVTSDGYVKILDFGLAKLPPQAGADSEAATINKEGTAAGTVIGTASYMSPEQALGKPLDARTDVFSLGAVLYQMATGERLFQGETTAGLFNEILNKTPLSPSSLNSNLSGDFDSVIMRALNKDPNKRHPSAKELLANLGQITTGSPRTEPSSQKSIVVLPFETMSPDPEQEYFCDGMAEEIINTLSNTKGLRVVSRTSAFAFKGKHQEISEIGRKLAVENVLEGSVRKSGRWLRITAQLTNVADGYHLWSERYDRQMEDLFSVHDEIASRIASPLQTDLPTPQRVRPSINLEAHDAYLKGRFCCNKGTFAGFQDSIRFFEQAIETDPRYAQAYIGLAETYFWLGFIELLPPKNVYPRSREAALKARELDDTLAEAHAALGSVEFVFNWDWARAESEFRRAIELNPNFATSHQQYSVFLGNLGRLDEAIAEMKLTLEFSPLYATWNAEFGFLYFVARRYEEALEQLRHTLEPDPNHPMTRWTMGTVYLQKGLYNEAIGEYEKAVDSSGGGPFLMAGLAHAYAVTGRKDEALKILGDLTQLKKEMYVSSVPISWIYIGLGDLDQAFQSLEKAYSERATMLINLPTVQWWDPIRDDPRIKDFLRRMNFPE